MSCEFVSLASCATAAAARTYMYEDRLNGGLRARDRLQQLLGRLHNADDVSLRLCSWIRSCALCRLAEAADALSAAERSKGASISLMAADPLDEETRRTWQRQAVAILRPRVSEALPHARERLDRWPLALPPGRRPARLVAAGRALSTGGAPRVAAAFIRTAFNGWCTARRFQQRAVCLLGCQRGEDSIEHYSRCATYHRFCAVHAGLAAPAAEDKLACFLNLEPSTLSRRGGAGTRERARLLRALTVYAVYRVQAAVRTGTLRVAEAAEALPAMLREGARGHPASESLLRTARHRQRG